jgi:hypothetical protein
MLRAISLAALGLGLAALSAGPALAFPNEEVVVHVPFPFVVTGKTLPAGDYVVTQLEGTAYPPVVDIRSTDGRHSALALEIGRAPLPRGAQPDLVFDKYGTTEFLHEVRVPEYTGAVIEPSPAEIRAAQEQRTALARN